MKLDWRGCSKESPALLFSAAVGAAGPSAASRLARCALLLVRFRRHESLMRWYQTVPMKRIPCRSCTSHTHQVLTLGRFILGVRRMRAEVMKRLRQRRKHIVTLRCMATSRWDQPWLMYHMISSRRVCPREIHSSLLSFSLFIRVRETTSQLAEFKNPAKPDRPVSFIPSVA